MEKVINQVKNMLIIPCFGTPIYESIDTAGFNLYKLFEIETRHYFPSEDPFDIQKNWIDCREGHLCQSTHETLAEQVANSLRPDIFVCDYDLFVYGQTPFENIFKPR
jgi:hypothetical protein